MTTKENAPWESTQFCGLVYGNPGIGKTFFAATMPKPMKVFLFDPPSKALAYRQEGFPGPIVRGPDESVFQFVYATQEERDQDQSGTGKGAIIEMESFVDRNPAGIGTQRMPCAYERFQSSMIQHMNDDWKGFKSVVLDSYTFCELACVRLQKYKINPAPGGIEDSKHNQMQWAGQARHILQLDIMTTFPYLPCHGCVIAHVDDQRHDEQEKKLWGVAAIGRLVSLLPCAFGEVYFMYRKVNDKTQQLESWLLTETDGSYISQSHINAPNPCKPTWEALWTNYK